MREKSLFWYDLWQGNDKPDHGIVCEIMKSTRHSYHYILRRA